MNIPDLSESARVVLSSIVMAGESTRPLLSVATSLSKPTVSLAIAELEASELVAPLRSSQGHTGRAASVYGLSQKAGWLLGIDLGSTHVRAVACALDGTTVTERLYPARHARLTTNSALAGRAAEVVSELLSVLRRSHGPLRGASIALSKPVQPLNDQTGSLGASELTPDIQSIIDAVAVPRGVPLLVENNVSCAALGELRFGAGRGRQDFAYLQVGVGIGAGIVAGGRLQRGAHGAAGELRMIPFPLAPNMSARRYGIEKYLGSAGLLRRCRVHWGTSDGPPPRTVEDLFRRATEGSKTAQAILDEEADGIANLVLALEAVVDPALVIVGGGIGQNEALLTRIRETARTLGGQSEIVTGQLGDLATVTGAAVLATDHALNTLLTSRYRSSAFDVPPTVPTRSPDTFADGYKSH